MYKLLLPVMGLAAFVACEPTECVDDTSDTGDQCADDTAGPGDTDPGIDLQWDSSGVTVTLSNMNTTGFDFGMAETMDMSGGWFGEDCLNGTEGYNLCHVFNGTTTGSLDSVFDEVSSTQNYELIVEGSTTLFDNTFASRITYVVTVDSGDCFVWGHDPSYYLDSGPFGGCSEIQ